MFRFLFSWWPGVWEQLQCGLASKGHRAVVGAAGGVGSFGLCPKPLDRPAQPKLCFRLRWAQRVEFKQQMRSCLLERYLEIKAQITSGNTVIQKSPMLMELYRNMLWLVLDGQCFGTLSSFFLIVQVTSSVKFSLTVICKGFCLLSLEL